MTDAVCVCDLFLQFVTGNYKGMRRYCRTQLVALGVGFSLMWESFFDKLNSMFINGFSFCRAFHLYIRAAYWVLLDFAKA